jgi:elongation factor Tu
MSADPSFRMTIEDVFSIRGRGTVATGRVESGTLSVGDTIHIKGQSSSGKVVVTGIEAFRKVLNQAHTGDIVGVSLRGLSTQEVQHGDVLMGSDSEFSSSS